MAHVQPSEMPRLTLTQALNLIAANEDEGDPHRGGIPITSADQLRALAAGLGGDDED